MKQIKQFVTWLLKTLRNIAVYSGWPFLVAIIIHWIVANQFPTGFFLGFYIGAAVALSWDEIRKQILEAWNSEK